MTFQEFIFYFFAAILVFAALRVITAHNPVHAALFLVLAGPYFSLVEAPRPPASAAGYSNTKELGRLLYTDYVYPFELAAVILLVAIVAAIALTLRRRKHGKYIDPAEQVKVRREDRVRMVTMPSEKNLKSGGD